MASISTYTLIFVAGLAASAHCVGMCGGFVLALGAASPRPRRSQLLYHLGRGGTLVAIGGLCGAAGAAFVAQGPLHFAERLLAIAAGVLMFAVGLENLGYGRRITEQGTRVAKSTVGRALGGVMRSRSPLAPFAFGVFNAFLPCQLIYAFAASAAATGSMGEGMLTMLAFALGTAPALLAVSFLPRAFSQAWRRRLGTASTALVLVFALFTIGRGFGFEHWMMGHGAQGHH